MSKPSFSTISTLFDRFLDPVMTSITINVLICFKLQTIIVQYERLSISNWCFHIKLFKIRPKSCQEPLILTQNQLEVEMNIVKNLCLSFDFAISEKRSVTHLIKRNPIITLNHYATIRKVHYFKFLSSLFSHVFFPQSCYQ